MNNNIYNHLFVSPLYLDENFIIKNFQRFPGDKNKRTIFGPGVNPKTFTATAANVNIRNNNKGFGGIRELNDREKKIYNSPIDREFGITKDYTNDLMDRYFPGVRNSKIK